MTPSMKLKKQIKLKEKKNWKEKTSRRTQNSLLRMLRLRVETKKECTGTLSDRLEEKCKSSC